MVILVLKKSNLLALVSFFVFSCWGIMSLAAIPQFQNSAATDPLAMVNVLFPQFIILLLVFVGICFAAFLQTDSPRWLHMFLIGQLAVMLYFTPFLLSGFSWSPDSLWHGGVAEYMPQVLSGSKLILTQYGQTYPFSFLISYFMESVLRIGVFNYTLYIYPLISIIIISELAYTFAARLFNHKLALLSMLLTLPALHYFEPHVSPFSMGTILVFSSLILLTFESRKAKALSFGLILILTITHPISPLVLGVYLLAAIIMALFFRKVAVENDYVPNASLFPLFIFLGVIWFSWTVFYAMPNYFGVQIAVQNIFDFKFLSKLLYASEFTVSGQGWAGQLGLAIYAIFLLLFLTPFVWNSIRILFHRSKERLTLTSYRLLTLSFAALIYAVVGYLLFLSSGERFLLGRGLLFFIFMGSMVIAIYLVGLGKTKRNMKMLFAFGLVAFLVCTFPFISYSKEAYNTFTPSAGAGLSFLSTNINLADKTLSMGYDQQLASYVDLSQDLYLLSFPPTTAWSVPLDGWTVSSFNNTLYELNSADTELSLILTATDGSGNASIVTDSAPKIKLPPKTLLNVDITGENARVSFVIYYVENQMLFDFSVGGEVNTTGVERFDLDPIAGKSLNGLVKIELNGIELNRTLSSIDISKISFEVPPPNLEVFRVNSYYFFATGHDSSFDEYSYNLTKNRLSNAVTYSSMFNSSILYNKAYSNEKFEIYVRCP
jgi:hypothetical protein